MSQLFKQSGSILSGVGDFVSMDELIELQRDDVSLRPLFHSGIHSKNFHSCLS